MRVLVFGPVQKQKYFVKMLYLNSSMYGLNAYKRLEVDYPSDTQIVKQPDANLSNYNTSLSRTVLHDENRYSDRRHADSP